MITKISLSIVFFSFSEIAFSSECAMKPSPIDIARIARNPLVKSYVANPKKFSLAALLKNGRALKLVHSGCDHSGAEVILWLDTERPLSDVEGWVDEANSLAGIAFSKDIANDISNSIKAESYLKETTEVRLVMRSSPTSFMSYSIVISKVEHGYFLMISFELG